MKHQDKLSFVTDDQAEQMGADMAIQFMLATLFQIVSEMADEPRGFRTDVHRELTDLMAAYKLPPMPEDYIINVSNRYIRENPGRYCGCTEDVKIYSISRPVQSYII